MNRPAALAGVLAVLATAALAAPSSAGASTPGARVAHASAKERAAWFASDRGGPEAARRAARSGPAALAAMAPHDSAALSGGLSSPTLLFTQSVIVGTQLASNIVVRNLQTTAQAALLPSSSGCPFEAEVAPDASAVVYLDYGHDCSEAAQLMIFDTASQTSSVLVSPGALQFLQLPNWKPDSGSILYTMEQDDSNGFVSSQLFTIPPTGGSPTPVAGGGSAAYDGVWSPDGNKIAYAPTSPSNANYLAVMDANGSNAVDLTTTAFSASSPLHPAWSPDGSALAFQYNYETGAHSAQGIGTVHVDDSHLSQFSVTLDGNAAEAPTWSGDGTEVLYDAFKLDGIGDAASGSAIYATDSTGQRRATVLTDPLHDYASPSVAGPGMPAATASSYTPVTPTRLLARTPLGPGGFVDVQVSGGGSPVPSGATAVTLNLTGVGPSAATYLQAYPKPADASVPLISNLNLVTGQVSAVAVQVTVSSDGYVRIRNQAGTTGVIVDITGWFAPGKAAGLYVPVAPSRFASQPGEGKTISISLRDSVPAGFTAVAAVLNLTAAHPTKATYLSAYPTPATDGPPPLVSNLNLRAGETRANLVTVALSAGPDYGVQLYNKAGSVIVYVDVVGLYGTGGSGALAYYPVAPARFLDTRNGTDSALGSVAPVPAGTSIQLGPHGTAITSAGMLSIPSTAAAYVYNLIVVAPTAATYLTAYPFGSAVPFASSVNSAARGIVPNLAVTQADGAGRIAIYNHAGQSHVVADIAGYYAP